MTLNFCNNLIITINFSGTNELQAKVFTERESLLTELLELKHFKILKHIFLAILFGFVATDLVKALAGKSQ